MLAGVDHQLSVYACMCRMRLIWVTSMALVLLAAGAVSGAAASPTRASGATLGPLRAWGHTEIRSLDPPLAAAAAGPRQSSGRLTIDGVAPSSPAASGAPAPRPDTVLSNEATFTRWAYVSEAGTIYQRAATDSPRVTRLHWYTEDGFPEIYLLLRAHWNAAGQEWIKLRIPMRPNGRTGWVRRQDLGALHLTHTQITVDRARLRMYLNVSGHRVWSAPVGVGKPSTPTPSGHFWIRERFKIESPSSGYWPYAFGTSDYSTLTDWPGGGVVGIHGPYYEPSAIPGRISHGCIRLGVADDAWLAHHIGLGTPVDVR